MDERIEKERRGKRKEEKKSRAACCVLWAAYRELGQNDRGVAGRTTEHGLEC
jgi:hypothetical protein